MSDNRDYDLGSCHETLVRNRTPPRIYNDPSSMNNDTSATGTLRSY